MSFKSLNASQKKMYLFAIYTIDTLKAQGIVRDDFDTFHVDLSLIESFDYDAYTNEYKAHFKKPRAAKILKHSSEVLRDSSDDVVVALANEFYENEQDNKPICFDLAAVATAGSVGGVGMEAASEISNNNNNNLGFGLSAEVSAEVSEKPKRKYSRKPKAGAAAEVSADVSVDAMVDMLSASLNTMSIQLHDVYTNIQNTGVEAAAADVSAEVSAEVVSEKPKRKYNRNRKPKVDADAAADSSIETNNVIESSSSLQNINIDGDLVVADAPAEVSAEVVSEKPKRKNTKKASKAVAAAAEVSTEVSTEVSAAADAVVVDVSEKPKRKNTKKASKTAAEVSLAEVSAAEVSAAEVSLAEVSAAEVPAEKPKRKYTKKTAVEYIDENVPEIAAKIVTAAIQGVDVCSETNTQSDEEEPIQIVRTGTPILRNASSYEDEEHSEPYEDEDDSATLCDDAEDADEYEDIVTKKVNIRGTDYLIGENNKVYDCVSQKTIGKYRADDLVLF